MVKIRQVVVMVGKSLYLVYVNTVKVPQVNLYVYGCVSVLCVVLVRSGSVE